MHKMVNAARKAVLYMSALVLVAGYPTAAMATAEEPIVSQEISTTEPAESQAAEPEKDVTYTYDPTTKKWNSDEWQYNQESGAYEQPPQPVIIEPEVSSVKDQGGDELSSEVVDEDVDQSLEKTVNSEVDINNQVNSEAISGDALISGNTKAGSALSGDAAAVANIINSVNSSIGADGNQKIATFTRDIYGDVSGDIILYPLLLKAMLEQEARDSGVAINASTDFDINNNVTLNAQSGNATVENNTEAGDATTGNATAMANVINILNSMIATQDSFVGTINIYGSLDGDILIAPDFIPQMLANNGGGDSNTQLSSEDTTTIVNNISAVAESGAASVFGNTNGGSASSGDAESSVVIFNVTGRNIVAENSMLVFVNVLGRWVGMIVDAPAGATAAMIGNGVVSNDTQTPDLTLESQSKHGITNTIAVNAGSGDATVANNTTGGNATSGNAHALANIANVSNSSLSLTGWFGVLFINITGDWFGSFQIDTKYGNKPEESTPQPSGPVQFVPQENKPIQNVAATAARVVVDSRFVSTVVSDPVVTETEAPKTETKSEPEVMGVMDEGDTDQETGEKANYTFLIVAGSIILIGGSVVGVRRIIA